MRRALIAMAMTLAGCMSPAVGLECVDGLTLCDGSCVDTASDPDHCGSCGVACFDAEECLAGLCQRSDRTDASVADGGGSDGGGSDAGGSDGGTGCGLGTLRCGDSCVDVRSELGHCGDCDALCDELCVDGECVDACDAPRVTCGERCVSTESDWQHCGGCDRRCPSRVCDGGECVPFVAGHVVYIGLDYTVDRWETRRLAGNAVFLADGPSVNVVGFRGHATSLSVDGIHDAIQQRAAERGGAWTLRHVAHDRVSLELDTADVLVVYPQTGSDDETLAALGNEWGVAMNAFVRRGGVIVVFDGPAEHAGTQQILQRAGLLGGSSAMAMSGRTLEVLTPTASVVLGLPSSYLADDRTAGVLDMGAGTTIGDGVAATVVHNVLYPSE
ncbi:MAG: MXAN_6577-like cysteine-rich protein [Sandaracinaceae bacterium]